MYELFEQEFAWFSKKPSILFEQWSIRKKNDLHLESRLKEIYMFY